MLVQAKSCAASGRLYQYVRTAGRSLLTKQENSRRYRINIDSAILSFGRVELRPVL